MARASYSSSKFCMQTLPSYLKLSVSMQYRYLASSSRTYTERTEEFGRYGTLPVKLFSDKFLSTSPGSQHQQKH